MLGGGLSLHPTGTDQRAGWEGGRTALAVVNTGDQHVDRGLPGNVVVLVHAGPVGRSARHSSERGQVPHCEFACGFSLLL